MIEQINQFNAIAEISVHYSHLVKPSQQTKVCSSGDIYNHIFPLWKDMDYRETFAILFLSRASRILGIQWLSTGGTTGTVVDAKMIFQAALKVNANSIVMIHNHPSCNLQPSDADIKLTRKIKAGGELLNINVIDHIIFTSEGYYSFADEGIL